MTATSPLSDCDQFRDYPTGRCLCFYAVASDHSANTKGCIHINQHLETEHWVYWTLLKSCLRQMQSRSLNIHFFCFVLFFLSLLTINWRLSLITDPRSSLTKTKSSRKGSRFRPSCPWENQWGLLIGSRQRNLEVLWLCITGGPRLGCVRTNVTSFCSSRKRPSLIV